MIYELIDTLWNVNSRLRHFKLMLNFELIDTLWNVNESAPADWVEQLRINRYIMECKCAYINATVQCSGN